MSLPDAERLAQRRAFSPVFRAEDFHPLSSTVHVEFGAHTDGRPRNAPNDDHYLVVRLGRSQDTILTSLLDAELPPRFIEYAYAMLLADGIGVAGAVASRVAVTTLVHLALHYGRWNMRVDSRTAFEILERLDWYYGKTDAAVRQHARTGRHLKGMATKLIAVYSAGDELFIAQTGGPLAYIYRDGRLQNLFATDPSSARVTATQGPRLIQDEDRDLAAVLSESIGGAGKLIISLDRFQLRNGDTLMLCTEGLTATLPEEQIADTLADRRRPEDICHRLVDAALDARAIDNVTVLLAQYRIPGKLP